MRTSFTSEDVTNIVRAIFNGNLEQSRASAGKIAYTNPNSEDIVLINESDGTQTIVDLAKYLNIEFYSWKDRLVEVKDQEFDTRLSVLEEWVKSLNFSMDKAYALVESGDAEFTASQDIDSAVIRGKITFLMQTNKISHVTSFSFS